MKDEKGLTLVELLAVIVILGIIAAIAVPSIGNIIDNSKKDAQIANAQQLISSAKLAVAANDDTIKNATNGVVTTKALQDAGFLDELTDPDDKKKHYERTSYVTISKGTDGNSNTLLHSLGQKEV